MPDVVDKSSDQIASGRRYRGQTTAERQTERCRRLVDAAVEAFAGRGYQATSIEQLCGAANVSTRNFYEHFADREALLAYLYDDLNGRALEAVVGALAGFDPVDLPARAAAGVRAYFEVLTADARWAKVALVESVGVSPAMEAHRKAMLDRFASLIEIEATRLADHGRLSARSYTLTAVALVGSIQALIHTWTSHRDPDAFLAEATQEASQIVVAALSASALSPQPTVSPPPG